MQILSQLLVEQPVLGEAFAQKIETLQPEVRGPYTEAVFRQVVATHTKEVDEASLADYGLISADYILQCDIPPIVWVVEGLLTVGLTILAGPPKAGKSFLGLQLARDVASGKAFLGHQTKQGNVVYLALEDPIRRLKERMELQGWEEGLPVHFLTIQGSTDIVSILMTNHCQSLRSLINTDQSRLVIIDTFSRVMNGDQMDVGEMTRNLAPVQQLAHETGCCILIIDHHRKGMRGLGESSQDPIADILGSTAKAGVADSIWGFYRQGKEQSARLAVTGRDVEGQSLHLVFEKGSHYWTVREGEPELVNPNLTRLLQLLDESGPLRQKEMAERLDTSKGNISKWIRKLEERGLVVREGDDWQIISNNMDKEAVA